jgi:capsid protein
LEEDCTSKVLAPIVEAWFKEARPKFGLDITAQDINIEAYWSGQRHVDPKKEAQANEVALQSGATTLDEIYAETGRDVERELERAAETLGMEVSEYKQLIIRNLFESDKREINDTEAE